MKTYSEPKIYPEDLDPKKKWFVAFRFSDPATGQSKQFQVRSDINKYKTKREKIRAANSLVAILEEKLEEGWNPFTKSTNKNQNRKTLIELLDELLYIKETTLKVKSYRSYKDANRLIQSYLLSKNLKTIMPGAFDRNLARNFADYLLTEKKYSGRTFNGMIGFVKTYFNMMIERDIITENPFSKIKRLPCDIGSNHAFSEREKKALVAAIKEGNIGLYYFINFMYHCFIRRSEITKIKIGDVDLINRTIRINSSDSKNRKQESVAIPDGFLPIIRSMNLNKHPDHYYIFGHGMTPGPIYYKKPDIITDMHRQYLKKLGIKHPKTLYSWKHTGVCDYYNVLKDPYVIMRQLRHHDLSITMIYLKSLGLAPNLEMQNANIAL